MSDTDRAKVFDMIMESAKAIVKEHMEKWKFPESHGFAHALQVLEYCEQALGDTVNEWNLPVRLAALLHEVDDRKYAPSCDPSRAKVLMDHIFHPWQIIGFDCGEIVKNTLRAIQLVSAYENGNDLPPLKTEEGGDAYLLIPRYADRLAAAGKEGVTRCFLYTFENMRPLYLPETPKPTTKEELAEVMKGRLEEYRSSGGQSVSMLDHYYDKLLHVVCPPPLTGPYRIPPLTYLEGRLCERSLVMIQVALCDRPYLRVKLGEILEGDAYKALQSYESDGSFEELTDRNHCA